MAYSGIGLRQRPTLKGTLSAGGALMGAAGGALMGGAGLIGAGLISSAGAGKYVAGAAAIGAGAKTGANWLGNKSFGGSGSSGGKEDTKEELSKVSSIGMLSVEKLDAIYNNVLDLRKFFASQDPESQEREKALDEKTKNKQLIAAIRGISTGEGGGMPEKLKTGFLGLLKDLLAISAIAALFANLDKVQEFLDKLPDWAEKISDAIDNIGVFLTDLDNFFEGIGIEFAGATLMGMSGAFKNARRFRGSPHARTPDEKKAWAKKQKQDKKDQAKRDKRILKKENDARKAATKRAAAAAAISASSCTIMGDAALFLKSSTLFEGRCKSISL